MKRIAIIGCGGINSWVVKHLADVLKMFDQDEITYVKLFDDDVVEEKNMLRSTQNFEIEDLMQMKAEALGKKFNFDFENIRIDDSNINILEQFDDIILGVDNHKTRRLIYDYCTTNKKYLLDLRAQGTQMAFYILDKTKDMKYYDEKFFSNKEVMERQGSCQLTEDVEKDHIENGNKIIAFMGMYGVYLKRLRDEEVSTNDYRFVY